MKPSTLLLALFAFGVSQAASSCTSNQIEEGDVHCVSASFSTGTSECAPGSQNADSSCRGEDSSVLLQGKVQHEMAEHEQEGHSLLKAIKTLHDRGDAKTVDKEHARDLAATDINAFSASNVVVENGDEATSDSTIEGDLKRLEQETKDFVSNKAGDADIKNLDKLREERSDLGNSLESKDVAKANFLQAFQVRAESTYASARSKIGEAPVVMLGMGVMLLLTAFIVIYLCGNMPRSQGGTGACEDFDTAALVAKKCEVWERQAVESPVKARERRILTLFHEMRGNAAGEFITAQDLQDLIRDPRVAKEFSDIGMHNYHEAIPSFNMLAHKSHSTSVKLSEFLTVSNSPDGQLLRLFTELDEANQSEDNPLGFLDEEDLHHMIGDDRLQELLECVGLTPEDLFKVFRVVEAKSGNGLVAIEEFIPACTMSKKKGRSRSARSISSAI